MFTIFHKLTTFIRKIESRVTYIAKHNLKLEILGKAIIPLLQAVEAKLICLDISIQHTISTFRFFIKY